MPKVSIVTASYNYENYIKETIESVLNQTFTDWEMIIVDDGSKDNSAEVIKSYCLKDERIKLYCHENGANKGLIETIKLALSKTNGEWVAFVESDDTIEPEYLEEKFKIIKKYPDADIIFNDINMFGDSDLIKNCEFYFEKQRKILLQYDYPSNLLKAFRKTHSNLIPTFSCVMIKKELLNNLDFNSPIIKGTDFYLWLQLLKNNKFYYIDKKLTNWRMHKSSYINTQPIDEFKLFQYRFKRIYFLYGRLAIFKYLLLFADFIRRSFIRIRVNKNKNELTLCGIRIIGAE